ncbi:unnamed protein product [Calicophoron daubneyi]|uniref:Katanin p80 WD40 repeat-containing subunit B1 n=1 Tax=Calicophoron daubneyi TaxID=300641 RepID=A0AAV2TFS6_CALDB
MKAWRLQECVAHSPGSVTCVALGRKSARVMATGGEDRRVKLWAVGKPTCILSLTGHTSSVEATEFSQEEDRVAAGSLSGSIRIWDLEEVKIVRALSGHTSAVSTLDFHPFGNFVASGSVDTLVKLWDVSRKGCINTYRGHSGSVCMIRFSPDGKWVASGGEDGALKLWDLSAGRLLAELTGHTGPVTGLAFHPTVLLLASASADRTVRLFDLENFTQVAMSGSELVGSVIRRIVFHPDGVCLYVATTEYLKIYDYETMNCLETVYVGWRAAGGLDDMAIAPSFNQLIGASICNSLVSTYVVDVKSCIPFFGVLPAESSEHENVQGSVDPRDLAESASQNQAPGDGSHQANQMPQERPYTRCGSSSVANSTSKNRKSFCLIAEENRQNALREDPTDPEAKIPYDPSLEDQNETANAGDINDPDEYNRVFKPHRSVPRSPTESHRQTSIVQRSTPPLAAVPVPRELVPSIRSQVELRSPAPLRPPDVAVVSPSPRNPVGTSLSVKQDDPPFTPPVSSNPPVRIASSGSKQRRPPSGPSEKDDLLPEFVKNVANSNCEQLSKALSESEALVQARKPHALFMNVMLARVKCLSTVRMMWTRDNIRTAVETAVSMNEPAVLVDILSVLVQNSKLWNLDIATLLLPQLAQLVNSKYSTHVEVCCQAVRVILKGFGQLIRQAVEVTPLPGVDLMREERQRKCRECMDHLLSIRSALESKEVASKAGQYGRELLVLYPLLS